MVRLLILNLFLLSHYIIITFHLYFEMKKLIQKLIFLLVVALTLQQSTSQCKKYNLTVCIQCEISYHLEGTNCLPDLTKINSKSLNTAQQPLIIQDSIGNTFNLVGIKMLQNSNINPFFDSSASPLTQNKSQQTTSLSSNAQNQLGLAQNNSPELVRVKKSESWETDNVNGAISLTDITSASPSSAFIRDIYSVFASKILQLELNKISLQLFQFQRQNIFQLESDPSLAELLTEIESKYKQQLHHSILLASFSKYQAFAKIYRIFYVDFKSISELQINQVDALVDLFRMKIYLSSFTVYCDIPINEGTLEKIRSSTRKI